jgi:hypothetical protein
MHQADLLYSGLMVTAVMLSVWVAALAAATCIFFAPTIFTPRPSRSASPKR